MKKVVSIFILMLVIASILTLSGCNGKSTDDPDGNVPHEHEFTVESAQSPYLVAEATCTSAARYYYCCECGEKGESTFAFGDPLPHTYLSSVIAPTCTDDGRCV